MNLRESRLRSVLNAISRHGLSGGLQDSAARWALGRFRGSPDVFKDFRWLLNESRPAELPIPTAGPFRINWLVPSITKGSGGLLNVFRAIHYLERWGHKNRVYTLGKWTTHRKGIQEIVEKYYFPVNAPIEEFMGQVSDSEALVATNWMSAYAVRSLGNTAGKFYFVQDMEDRFYPSGSLAEFAKETYRLGFHGITLGFWIAEVLRDEFGMSCSPFGFAYDREIYSCNGIPSLTGRTKRVLFYLRPNTERRGFELGILALSLVAKMRPDTEFVLAGSRPLTMNLPFSAVFPGILPPAELAALYRTCAAALVLSHTNLSMLPLELMACGCPVVSNSGRNVEWLLTKDIAQLASATPRALADATLELLEDDQLRIKKATAGLVFSQHTDWSGEIKRIESAFYNNLCISDRLHLGNSAVRASQF